jgi:hypothetical protein
MVSTIFFIVGGFGSCTGLEDCAPTVFSVVLSWLGGFFCGGFTVFQICFGGWAVFLMCFHGWAVFSAVLRCFCAFDGTCFAAIGFFCFFGGNSGLMSISWLELAPPELNNGSCVDGERGDIEGREDDLGDDDGRDCGGYVGGIDPSAWGIIM